MINVGAVGFGRVESLRVEATVRVHRLPSPLQPATVGAVYRGDSVGSADRLRAGAWRGHPSREGCGDETLRVFVVPIVTKHVPVKAHASDEDLHARTRL